jgi:flagellar motor component MotA
VGKGVRYCLGVSVFLMVLVFAIFAGGGPQSFVHFVSAIFVLATAGGLGLAGYRGNGFVEYIASFKKHLIPCGVLGIVIGVIQMLRNLSDPESFGAGLAVALLTLFYSLIVYGICEAFVNANRQDEVRATD